jgi:hypothetical protein
MCHRPCNPCSVPLPIPFRHSSMVPIVEESVL